MNQPTEQKSVQEKLSAYQKLFKTLPQEPMSEERRVYGN